MHFSKDSGGQRRKSRIKGQAWQLIRMQVYKEKTTKPMMFNGFVVREDCSFLQVVLVPQ
jgi:hypothetical protein